MMGKKSIYLLLFFQILFIPSMIFSSSRYFRVGVYDNPPKIFLNKDGTPCGIFIDILEEIARKENWYFEYIYGSWDKCLLYLNNGTIDLLPDIAYSKTRAEVYDFNKLTVLPSWLQLYSRRGYKILDFNKLEGKRVAVLNGSIQEELCSDIKTKLGISFSVRKLTNYTGTIDSVLFKNADYLIASRFLNFSEYGKELEPSPLIIYTSTLHFATLEGFNNDLLSAIDLYLIEFFNDPRSVYYESIEKWLHKPTKYFIPKNLRLIIISISTFAIIGILFSIILRKKVKQSTLELEKTNIQLRIAI